MYFVRSSLSCQTVFHVVSDWLYSFGVVFGCDMDAKVFVLSEFLSAKPEDTAFFFTNQDCCYTEFMTSAPSRSYPYNKSSTLEHITAMILGSSSRSVNRVGRIWFNENLNCLHVFSIGAANPRPASFVPLLELVRLKFLCLQFLLLGYLSAGIRSSKVRSISCTWKYPFVKSHEWRRGHVRKNCKRYRANPHQLGNLCEVLLSRNFQSTSRLLYFAGTETQSSSLRRYAFCLYQPISSDRPRNLLQSSVALVHPSK